jgi:hypothetical protein
MLHTITTHTTPTNKQRHHLPIRPQIKGSRLHCQTRRIVGCPTFADRPGVWRGGAVSNQSHPVQQFLRGHSQIENHWTCVAMGGGRLPPAVRIRPPVAEKSHFNLLGGFATVPMLVFVGVVCCCVCVGPGSKRLAIFHIKQWLAVFDGEMCVTTTIAHDLNALSCRDMWWRKTWDFYF